MTAHLFALYFLLIADFSQNFSVNLFVLRIVSVDNNLNNIALSEVAVILHGKIRTEYCCYTVI